VGPRPEEIAAAGRVLASGGLVAFPTETVYGLGANALDAAAVARIYETKGRPASSPLIVHVKDAAAARALAAVWPEKAEKLARAFWPGPLTMVVPKHPSIPGIVTAGLPTVGLRVPSHPVALALLEAAGVPLAAPSANRFTAVSPTLAAHVRASLGDAVPVLDAGPARVGIESTVVSLAGQVPVLLRPGMITRQDLARVIGPVAAIEEFDEGAHPAPGLHQKHYSPAARLLVVRDGAVPQDGRGVYVGPGEMPGDAAEYASALYARLHELDRPDVDWIALEQPPDGPAWEAIHDRLRRAAE